MISLGGLVNQKAFGKFEMGKVISNPFATAFIKEGEGEDHEVSMANNSLDTIIKMATELKAKMGENEKDIPAWIQDHITNAENFISQAASNYHEYGQNEARIAEDKGPCWKGYQQIGMKEKDGRQVPNCVPNESVVNEEPAKSTGEKIQNLNNRIKALKDKMSATKSSEQKNLIQQRLKNALQSLSNYKKQNVSKESIVKEITYNFGKEEYTKKNLTPTQIQDLAFGYVQTPITKLVGKTLGHRVNLANDLARLTGTKQLDAKSRGKEPALIMVLLKNKLVSKEEYIQMYKDLIEKHQQVIKYLKNASPEMRNSGGAARAAAKDMKGEFDMD